MKIAREWFNELPEPIRSKAIANISEELEVKYPGLPGAIIGAFVWEDTPEGASYWGDVLDRYLPTPSDAWEGVKEPTTEFNHRDHNVGDSDYSKYKIQVWDIWKEYNLNPWDADIIKRVLRNKESQDRADEYRKIIHVCQERISQLEG